MLKKAFKQLFPNRPIIFIFLVALGLRLVLLNSFPIGLTHDELNYVAAAKSIFLTGQFPSGTAPSLLPTKVVKPTVTVAEVPVFLLVPLIGPLPFSFFTARMMGAALSAAVVLLLYYLVVEILNDQRVALITAVVAAINPWSFLMGRTIFEVNFVVFFFLLGFLILLRNEGKAIFKAAPFYLLGFLSYLGGQVAFLFFILVTLGYHFIRKKKPKHKPYLAFGALFLVIFIGYLILILGNQSGATRAGEIYSPASQEITDQVDEQRKLAIPSSFNSFFINKATIWSKGFLEKYLNAFNVNTLFLNGELRAAFSYQKHGTFYILDFVFLIVGLAVLFKKDKKTWDFFLLIIAVSIITAGFSTVEQSYSQRTGLIFPFLIILVAVGISSVTYTKKMKAFVILIYLLFFANLLHLYFYRFPVYASEGWFFQDRILSQYLNLVQENFPDKKIVVSTFETKIIFHEYSFYTNKPNNLVKNKFVDGGVSFVGDCFEDEDLPPDTVWIFDGKLNCRNQTDIGYSRITRLYDNFSLYMIKNDILCSEFHQGQYVHPEAYRNFEVEKMDVEKFCTSFIARI